MNESTSSGSSILCSPANDSTDVHPDKAKQLDPKEFEKSGQTLTDEDDTDSDE